MVELVDAQVETLISILHRFKRAIIWTIVDIIGILLSIYTHKIYLGTNCAKHQVPTSFETTYVGGGAERYHKMDRCGHGYPNTNNKWVSPVQYVPKKGRITMVLKEKNKLVPIRPVTR